jgi:hypothetical protein
MDFARHIPPTTPKIKRSPDKPASRNAVRQITGQNFFNPLAKRPRFDNVPRENGVDSHPELVYQYPT